jgi:hypothetical protein
MDAPKCKICGAVHWSNEPHQFAGKAWKPEPPVIEAKAKPAKKPAKAKRVEPGVVTIAHHKVKDLSPEGVKAIAEGLAKKRGRPKLHPDRKAYKAEKERARRAAAKKAPRDA